MTKSKENDDLYEKADNCHICGLVLDRKAETPRRDHCHLTGKFRGAAHNACNLKYQLPTHIPVFFHNLSGYDAHFLVEHLAKFGMKKDQVNILPESVEQYISFSKRMTPKITLRFLDSLRFMQTSLQKLVETLPRNDMHITRSAFTDEEKFQLATRKGVFPYEYLDSMAKLNETRLPDITSFTSTLTGDTITITDYEHAVNVWQEFNIPNLGEYARLYMDTDVRLLADVFEKFRSVCMTTYSLDPAFYYTAPGLSWDAMLKKTDCNIGLLTDASMLLFFERGIRGGLCQCVHRHAKANNPRMGVEYNASLDSSYILYLDVNNLYGHAMKQPLPVAGFQWVPEDELKGLGGQIMGLAADSDVGYVLEADIAYPNNLHGETSDLPLCPEQQIPRGSTIPKLMATVGDKQRYIIHYRNLQQCLRLGMELIKITRAISFKQSPWLKEYIELNTEKRAVASNDFEKDFYKLMNNSIFGKNAKCKK
ncbi:uncharacterized protein LOC126483947 isoform X1 [Schistocerca serialis cubense]|uniref:uncharacterized protein LOC126483947 isoform X1 n=1 Tax=Schistocerca serialis cubense TaxID=2023355 RepID=UPI00214DF871|nr:uncharacterized protein LOC126483947 isoform X1 [Schistocerca serialis cubense]